MREIPSSAITEKVTELALEASYNLRPDVLAALEEAAAAEESERGKRVLWQLLENAHIAKAERLPLCQDTGAVAVYVRLGRETRVDGDLYEAVQEGVRRAYVEGYLRKSINSTPAFGMRNTGDNTPADVHFELASGDDIEIIVMPKGGGSENASALRMLPVSGGVRAVEDFVLEVARGAAAACPPLVLGVAIGGGFATAAATAKKALLRDVGDSNRNPELADLEKKLLDGVNALGIGPGGLGGRITALAVKVESRPAHIACLPVAVCVSCHALRSATGRI